MTHAALIIAIVVCANSCSCMLASLASRRYGIACSLLAGVPLCLLLAGSSAEVWVLLHQADAAAQLCFIAASAAVVASAASDAASGYVFDAVTFSCAGVLALVAAATQHFVPFLAGAAVCGGALAMLYVLTRGRGLGLGDVKLACCIGGGIGAAAGLQAIALAFVLGGAYAALLLIAKRARRGEEMRFAPYLSAGMSIVSLYGVYK